MSNGIALLVDDHHGQYVPQVFAKVCGGKLTQEAGKWGCWHGFTVEDLNILLKGPDYETNPGFNDTWTQVLDSAYFLDEVDGKKWMLQQDGSLWAYCLEKMTLRERHDWDMDVSDELNAIMDKHAESFDVDYDGKAYHGYVWFGKGDNAELKSSKVFGTADAAMLDCIEQNHLE